MFGDRCNAVELGSTTLQVGEWRLWRQLRFDALSESPDAFGPTLEEEKDQPDDWWTDIIDSTVEHPRGGLWIAEMERVPMGMLFARTDTDDTVVEIGAMWVRPPAREKGIGPGLLTAALDWAISRGVRHAELWVTESNIAAASLYERYGFRRTAETQALRAGSDVTVMKMQTAI
jgi:GNAT superfamily N-acetyltransferase